MSTRITRFDDFAGDARAIAVRAAPLDVGFDLRAEKMAVQVPADTTIASYADRQGRRFVVEGTAEEIRAVLRKHGYLVQMG